MKKNPTKSLIIFCACLAFCLLCAVGINMFSKIAKYRKSHSESVDLELVSNMPICTITIIDTGETIYQHTAPITIVEWDRKNKYLEFIDYDDDGKAQRIQWNEYCVVLITSSTDAYIGGGR